jgi:hypothetical protein
MTINKDVPKNVAETATQIRAASGAIAAHSWMLDHALWCLRAAETAQEAIDARTLIHDYHERAEDFMNRNLRTRVFK